MICFIQFCILTTGQWEERKHKWRQRDRPSVLPVRSGSTRNHASVEVQHIPAHSLSFTTFPNNRCRSPTQLNESTRLPTYILPPSALLVLNIVNCFVSRCPLFSWAPYDAKARACHNVCDGVMCWTYNVMPIPSWSGTPWTVSNRNPKDLI